MAVGSADLAQVDADNETGLRRRKTVEGVMLNSACIIAIAAQLPA